MELMLGLSAEVLKILSYLREDLVIEASKSKFLMSICLQNKVFKVHIQVKQMSCRFQIVIIIIFIIINLFFVEIIAVPKKLIKFNFKI